MIDKLKKTTTTTTTDFIDIYQQEIYSTAKVD